MAGATQIQQEKQKKAAEVALEAKYTAACKALDSGTCKNIAKAAAHYQVPYYTLRRRYKNLAVPRSRAHKHQQLLTDAQETICHWIKYMGITGHPLSKWSLCMKVGDLSEKLKEKVKSTKKFQSASRAWVEDFLRRHPDIKLAWPTGLNPKCAQMFNFAVVNHHFKLLDDFLKAEGIPWENVYNMDEKGIQLGGGRKCDYTKYLYSRKQKVRIKIQSANLELVTVIECVCADGSNLKPGFVFSGKDVLQEEHFEEDSLLVALSPKGWTSDFISQEWFEKASFHKPRHGILQESPFS
ncbi:hypothetical protein PAXINDRAFT_18495 [Paxillus involutus ATCC 200175]|uniref:HTH CENPB-type domain-containing protein n=1 Tax=Paxillus involutus ATCC 200175 TaxID=664439 RepID=A0A0C9SYT2_PAXIN|nr:hypothetical protein PAXINDRAFT_18495 [Paxillus involutus ATCC 200175]